MIDNGNQFNNPDSFAMAFDEAWKMLSPTDKFNSSYSEKKLEEVFASISEHPFLKANPTQALEIAKFRKKLLNLK